MGGIILKTSERIDLIKELAVEAKRSLYSDGEILKSVNRCLHLIVEYIDFMVTPCEEDE